MARRRSSGPDRVEEAGTAAVDRIAGATHAIIERCRRDFAAIAEKVDRDIAALRPAAIAPPDIPNAIPPGATAPPVGPTELSAMLRTAVVEVLASEPGKTLIGAVMQERFRGAAEQLRAQQQKAASPLHKLRSVASHKRP